MPYKDPEKQKAYLKKHANKLSAYKKTWYQNNKERILKERESYRNENKSSIKQYQNTYAKNNRSLKYEALKTGLINEKNYEIIVDPKKMIYPK